MKIQIFILYTFQCNKNEPQPLCQMNKNDKDSFINIKADNEVLRRQLDGNQ